MGALSNILMYSVGSLLLGVLLTIVGIVLMFVLIRLWYRNCTFTPLSFVVGGVLFFFLAFQAVLICGAVTVKSYCDDVENAINVLVAVLSEDVHFSTGDSQAILDNISREWPLVDDYVNMADFQGYTPATIAGSMADELRGCINWFILRRVGWCLLFVVVGAFILVKTMEQPRRNRRTNLSHVGNTSDSRRCSTRPKRYDDF